MSTTTEPSTLAGLSAKTLVLATVVLILFGVYVGVLMYGENSVSVLTELKREKETLVKEVQKLKYENQQLQKSYFGYKQLAPKE